MDDTTRDRLMVFARNLNHDTPHALDRQRFYDLIIGEALTRKATSAQEIEALLIEERFRAEEARFWAARYDFGLELLARFRPAK